MIVVDADSHVEESDSMFELLDKAFYSRRPVAVRLPTDTAYGAFNAVWLIDGETYPKRVGKRGTIFRTPTLMDAAKLKRETIGAQEMTDLNSRIADMDNMGINQQVVFPTMFLTTTADDLKLEAALLRSYNDYLAKRCAASGGRIHFAALVPIRDVNESINELRRARGLGAITVMLLGMAWDKLLGDESLFPFYEVASELDMPICVHLGWGCPAIRDVFEATTNFYGAIVPVLIGFHSIMTSGLLEAFPKLRIGFLEAGCQWLPYLIRQVRTDNAHRKKAKDPVEYFRAGRVFVACEGDEEINGVAHLIGDETLVVGSDYPHGDPSRQEDMVGEFKARSDLAPQLVNNILSDNPRRLYGL